MASAKKSEEELKAIHDRVRAKVFLAKQAEIACQRMGVSASGPTSAKVSATKTPVVGVSIKEPSSSKSAKRAIPSSDRGKSTEPIAKKGRSGLFLDEEGDGVSLTFPAGASASSLEDFQKFAPSLSKLPLPVDKAHWESFGAEAATLEAARLAFLVWI